MVGVPRAPQWVPPMHHGLGNPVRGHSGWSILPVAHLEHRLEQLQIALKGHAPETTQGAKLIQGLGEVQCRMKLWLLEACILPFRYLLEGREKGVVQLVELIPWLGVGAAVARAAARAVGKVVAARAAMRAATQNERSPEGRARKGRGEGGSDGGEGGEGGAY